MPLQFTIAASPTTFWKVRVFVWPNKNQFLKARCTKGESNNNCVAFCYQLSKKDAAENGEEVAEIHFNRKDLRSCYIVHECYHALYAYKRLIELDERKTDGEEQAAEAIEHMVDGITWMLKKERVRVTR